MCVILSDFCKWFLMGALIYYGPILKTVIFAWNNWNIWQVLWKILTFYTGKSLECGQNNFVYMGRWTYRRSLLTQIRMCFQIAQSTLMWVLVGLIPQPNKMKTMSNCPKPEILMTETIVNTLTLNNSGGIKVHTKVLQWKAATMLVSYLMAWTALNIIFVPEKYFIIVIDKKANKTWKY